MLRDGPVGFAGLAGIRGLAGVRGLAGIRGLAGVAGLAGTVGWPGPFPVPGRSAGPRARPGGRVHHAQQPREEPVEVCVHHRRIHMNSCTAQLRRWYSRCVIVAPYNSGLPR
jgi:hypothetical protein